MASRRSTVVLSALLLAGPACDDSSSPSPIGPTPAVASVVIAGLTATGQPLTTTSQPGFVYRLIYVLRETGGRIGVTPVRQRFELSDGYTTEGNFSGTTRVPPGGSAPIVSSLSIYPRSVAASHVTFTITYTDDNGVEGTATASAAITPVD